MGRGIGLVDMHLLASTLLTPEARLWTHDKRLAQAAYDLSMLAGSMICSNSRPCRFITVDRPAAVDNLLFFGS